MARNKPLGKKLRLARAGRLARAVPTWIIAKTRGRVRTSNKRRRWRQQRIKP
ncbi:MAG: 50S ribosomal protein L39e [Candidatus Asgardarchaeum sp.]|nr:50S ribosomal protein L39e [Candidatus Odinarchaeota archaeon]